MVGAGFLKVLYLHTQLIWLHTSHLSPTSILLLNVKGGREVSRRVIAHYSETGDHRSPIFIGFQNEPGKIAIMQLEIWFLVPLLNNCLLAQSFWSSTSLSSISCKTGEIILRLWVEYEDGRKCSQWEISSAGSYLTLLTGALLGKVNLPAISPRPEAEVYGSFHKRKFLLLRKKGQMNILLPMPFFSLDSKNILPVKSQKRGRQKADLHVNAIKMSSKTLLFDKNAPAPCVQEA